MAVFDRQADDGAQPLQVGIHAGAPAAFAERPAAGTVLVRKYKGVEYRVIATADGQYDFEGRMYPSLSMIAREITGMRWSGPLFFGLRPPSNAKTKPSTKKGGGR
nr:DUF2924 domain-containing protein [Methylocaldum marinum]